MKSEKLARSKIHQLSINSPIDYDSFIKIFYNEIEEIEKIYNSNDTYERKIYEEIKFNKTLPFEINKHVEFYVLKHQKDIQKIFKYIIFRYKFYLAGHKKINLGYPPYLLIEPVSTCNLRCPFCFQTDKTFTRKPFMGVIDFSFFKNIIDQADKIGVGAITIASRGEPTMHKKFINMLEYMNSKKNIFEIKINTNGTFLNADICHAIFKYNVTQVVISSDHYIKEDYERLRKGSNFEKVLENVDRLFKIRSKYYPYSITEIRISGVDNEKNLDRKKFRDFWIKRADHVTASYPLERWNTYLNIEHPEIRDPCENLWDRMYIWFDGKVNPCDADYKSYLSYGSAKEYSIKKLWNDKIISNMRTKHIEKNRNDINPCDRCGVTFI